MTEGMLKYSKCNVVIPFVREPAVHAINDFQENVPLMEAATMLSLIKLEMDEKGVGRKGA
jgi:hypothetical protein